MDRMGQSRRNADRKIKLDVWRVRIGLVIKLAGIACLAVGVMCMLPTSIGASRYGVNQFDKIAGSPPLIPLGAWLLVAGILLVVIGYVVSSDWGLS